MRVTQEKQIEAAQRIIAGEPYSIVAKDYGTCERTIRRWVDKYRHYVEAKLPTSHYCPLSVTSAFCTAKCAAALAVYDSSGYVGWRCGLVKADLSPPLSPPSRASTPQIVHYDFGWENP